MHKTTPSTLLSENVYNKIVQNATVSTMMKPAGMHHVTTYSFVLRVQLKCVACFSVSLTSGGQHHAGELTRVPTVFMRMALWISRALTESLMLHHAN